MSLLYLLTFAAGGGLVGNPSFEEGSTPIVGVGYLSQGNTIARWEAVGEVARCTQGLAFFDNGAVPDGEHVVALQNLATLRQQVGPFQPDAPYRLSLRASGRASDATTPGRFGRLLARLNGTTLMGPLEIQPVSAGGLHTAPFRRLEATFIAGAGPYRLEIAQVDPAEGISVLVDDVRIEPVNGPAPGAIAVNRATVRPAGDPVTEIDFRATQWIWSPDDADPATRAAVGQWAFRRVVEVPDPTAVRRAYVIASADNEAGVYLNGELLGAAADFADWYEIDLLGKLRPGRNAIGLLAGNAGDVPNPAGLAAAVVILGEGDRVIASTVTDAGWKVSAAPPAGWLGPEFDDATWPAARVIGPVGIAPWGHRGFLTWLVPADFPSFTVPGAEREMRLLRQLHWLHYGGSGPKATLWDAWMSMCSLWPAVGAAPGANEFRDIWRASLTGRPIDGEGYVSTIQHHGFGHGEGWPFPTAQQAGGVAWQFATDNLPYRVGPVRRLDGWTLRGLEVVGHDTTAGLTLRVVGDEAVLQPPAFDIDRFVAPFARLEWQPEVPAGATATLEFATPEAAEFGPARRLPLPLTPDVAGRPFTHVPLYRHADPATRLTGLRLTFHGAGGGTLRLAGLALVPDTRHPINNPNYLQGCCEYFQWTGDVSFLTDNLARMRRVLDFAVTEFAVEAEGCVLVPWVGHDGRSGLSIDADGTKTIHPGRGIGANYWDLLPFSGRDCLATIYMFDALRRMAALEAEIARHPDWDLPAPALAADRLSRLADDLRRRGGQRFWNETTGRFVASIDLEGRAYDYGYTFVNTEAVAYGFATPEQAASIVAWLDGARIVAGDTSTGADIYHWRFGPRASTRRNIEWYTFPWSGPESIPWGFQVQDGGAVLGFAYHDYTARLLTAGPDNAWGALRRTLDWFAEIIDAGGYRPYYAVPGRGTLQGGGPPGGLGMDQEFFESALVPQIMLYGFLGFRPEPGGFGLDPRLPADWPSLTADRVAYRGTVLTITATRDELTITCTGGAPETVRIALPAGWRGIDATASLGDGRVLRARRG